MGREGRHQGGGLILAATVALLLAGAQQPPLIYRSQCQMDVCSWVKEQSRSVLLRNSDGVLVRYRVKLGMSHHPDDNYPERYTPKLRISWKRATGYAFCSRSRPAYVFADDLDGRSRWVAHLLDLTNLFGYNSASAVIYMHACHYVAAGGEATAKRLAQYGYHGGTPNMQIILRRPSDIADRGIVRRAVIAGER